MMERIAVSGGLLLLLIHCVGQAVADSAAANGFGDNINWISLEEGFPLARSEGKPIMLIIHKSWCGACKALKPKFAQSKEIEELSEKFVMINTADDDEPAPDGDKYAPDGAYIPRIIFYNPDGTIIRDVINESGNAQFQYYYSKEDTIVSSMQEVLDKFSSSTSSTTLTPRSDKEGEDESEDSIINEDTRTEL